MQKRFEAIGTQWDIEIASGDDAVFSKIEATIEAYDKIWSRFRTDSLVTKMALTPGTYTLPPDSRVLIELYETLYRLTDGMFTPLIGNVLAQAGYDAQYTLASKVIDACPLWEDVISLQFPTLSLRSSALLDIGAAGKGHLIDIVCAIIEHNGVYSYCVDAGGDVRYRGRAPLRVGLEDPRDVSRVIGVFPLVDESICGSAGNRRTWGEYHHIINPKTKKSPTEVIATWVIAKSTLVADALSTCLFFVSPDVLCRSFDFEYVVLNQDYSVLHSPHFRGELF